MICLPFGRNKKVPETYDEIEQARTGDILLFAAAANNSSSHLRAYPASHGIGVFCIHSTTSEGNNSPYNPSPLDSTDNFSVVGDCIFSCSPSGTTMKLMSGTSFATPVAVAVAAFMNGYIRRKFPQHFELSNQTRTFDGMTLLFRMMAESRDGYDWVGPPHYFESRSGSEIIVQDIYCVFNLWRSYRVWFENILGFVIMKGRREFLFRRENVWKRRDRDLGKLFMPSTLICFTLWMKSWTHYNFHNVHL